jgi:uncharacterized protein (TIGR03032 family)
MAEGRFMTIPHMSPPSGTNITVSRGFASWLGVQNVSLAFTSYQTGQLFLVGLLPSGSVSFNQQNFVRAMGICYDEGRLWLGSLYQLWRLENMLLPGEQANGSFDTVFVPREGRTTGDIDIHEIGIFSDAQPVFVNTKHSCLATLDPVHSFKPYWTPPFISKLAAEDRCHLNGLAMVEGAPAYVTAVSQTDVLSGWRARREAGGVVIEVATGRVVTDQLSMPHSPRVANGKLYALDSGRGQLISIDPQTGAKQEIAFCPGFLRGLAIHNGFAVELEREITRRDGEPWCGIFVIDLRTGDLAEWIKLDGEIAELFDVAILPGRTCPMSLGVDTVEIQSTITIGGFNVC